MRVGIDACCWSNRRGFGRFTRELVTHIVAGFPQHEFTLVVDQWTAQAVDFPTAAKLVVVPTKIQPTQAASAEGSRGPFDLWRMSRAASRIKPEAFFFPAVYSFFPMLRRVPTVVTFHDAIAESHPGLIFADRRSRWFWNAKTWLARRQANRILTVSESARSQVATAFGLPLNSIGVITEGPNEAFRLIDDRSALSAARRKYRLPESVPLLLYVGGISPHKNLQGLLRALDRVRRESSGDWHAVLVGDHSHDSFYGCYQELLVLLKQLNLEDRVTFTGYVPNEDLVALYNTATLMVLPSFNEGFGLPVVEAMACGLPVAASDRGSLPEVVGDAGLLFNPDDLAEMAGVLNRLLTDATLRERLRETGLRRVERYSWQTAAKRTVDYLEELVRG